MPTTLIKMYTSGWPKNQDSGWNKIGFPHRRITEKGCKVSVLRQTHASCQALPLLASEHLSC